MEPHEQHSEMGRRGVSRPMHHGQAPETPESTSDETQPSTRQGAEHQHHAAHDEATSEQAHAMGEAERLAMLRQHHQQTLWIYWTLVMLAFWLILAPFTFGYLNESLWVDPSGGRGVWFSDQPHTALRAQLMTYSDVLAGLALLVFAWRSLTPNRPVSQWTCCFIGVWLTFAPILFWAPTAAAYLNDTIVGAWLIALTILIPGMPNMMMYMQHGPAQPPGWSYNPSSWPQRWIMIVLGFAGWLVSRYLAMYQLGYIDYVWDPFFGFDSGTRRVLDSRMSHRWPISDAGLGAISYTFEFLMGFMGSPARWRTMPWMVAFFGILVIPLGLTHILLVISQPVLVHYWCSLCLLAALIMLPMIPLEADEVIAMLQHVKGARRRGDRGGSLWKIFWKGGSAADASPDERSPQLAAFPQQPRSVYRASIWGFSMPWTLLVTTVLGVVLTVAPTAFGLSIRSTAADLGHLGGALLVTVSVICMGEVLRLGRFLNLLLGILIAAGVWFTTDGSLAYAMTCTGIGLAAAVLAVPRGRITERYGTWDRFVR